MVTGLEAENGAGRDGAKVDEARDGHVDGCEWTHRHVDGGVSAWWHAQWDARTQAQTHRGTQTWTQTHGGERKRKEEEIRAEVTEMCLHPHGPQSRRRKKIRMEKGEEEEERRMKRRMMEDER